MHTTDRGKTGELTCCKNHDFEDQRDIGLIQINSLQPAFNKYKQYISEVPLCGIYLTILGSFIKIYV